MQSLGPVRSVAATIAISLLTLPGAAQHLVTLGEFPNVSPDGSLIAFLSDRTGTKQRVRHQGRRRTSNSPIPIDQTGEPLVDSIMGNRNGQPLFFGMNASCLRSPELGLSALDRVGSALYLPLRQGTNELVFAVTEYTGWWAFWARLER